LSLFSGVSEAQPSGSLQAGLLFMFPSDAATFQRILRSEFSRNMLDVDDPDHPRLRGLAHKVFTPKMVENMRQRVESLTEELLDAVQPRGRMDLVREYALSLPTSIIAQMLGVPSGEQHNFHRWSSAIVSSQSSKWGS
jgi:cytochrome P450